MNNNLALPVTKHLTASSATGSVVSLCRPAARLDLGTSPYQTQSVSVTRLSRKHFRPTCVYVTKMMPTIIIPQQSLSHPSLARQTTSFSLHTYMECCLLSVTVSVEKNRLVAEPLVGTEYSFAVPFCCCQATWKGNMVLSEINKTNVIHRFAFLHLYDRNIWPRIRFSRQSHGSGVSGEIAGVGVVRGAFLASRLQMHSKNTP